MAQIDASIPLSFRPTVDAIDPTVAATRMMSLADLQQRMQAGQQQMGRDAQMRNIFADKSSYDEKGNLKLDAIHSIMGVDPKIGMAVDKSQLDRQAATADLNIRGQQLIEDKVRAPSSIAYRQAKERGMNDVEAQAVAQSVYSSALKDVQGSGMFSDREVQQMPTDFDFARVSSRSSQYLAWQEQQRKSKLEDDKFGETKRHDQAEEGIQRGTLGVAQGNLRLREDELKVNREILREPKYSNPVAVEVPGADGKKVVKEAQQDNNPRSPTYGKWVTADEKHEPVGTPERVIKGQVPTEDGMLKPEALKTMAEQYLAGDRSVFQNLGRGAQGSTNIIALRGEVAKQMGEKGMSGADMATKMAEFEGLKAGERTLGTRTANVEMAVNEAKNMIPIALAASEGVDRTKFPTLNSLILAGEKGTGGEAVVKLTAATNSLVNAYSRAISPTGVPTVSDKDHAREILSSAYSKGQYKAAVELLMQEMNAAQQSPGQVRQGFREGYGGEAPPPKAGGTWEPGARSPTAQIFSPASKADYDALPVGAHYRKDGDPEGSYRVKK